MRTKVRLLALVATTLAICSCKTLSTHTSGYTADTLHITTLHYDSIIIDRQTNTIHLHDTVLQLVTENRTHFKIYHDTIYISKTDSLHHVHRITTAAPSDNSQIFPFHSLIIIAILIILLYSIKSRK